MELESENLECKREYSESLKKTIIAFANCEGGTIMIGVNDDLTIRGVDNIDDTMLKVTNMIKDSIKPDLLEFINCSVKEISGKKIIVIVVTSGVLKPYYLQSKGLKSDGVFIRKGASSLNASDSHILKMIRENAKDSFEELDSVNQNLNFKEASRIFEDVGLVFGDSQKKSLGLINSSNKYTNLALLLSNECNHTIKLAVFSGTTKEKFENRKEFTGSILKQLDDCYEYMSRYNSVRSEIDGLKRKDFVDYPQIALRESLLNAIVHRDYALSASTLVSIFEDRIEILNTGGLLAGINESDLLLGLSSLRNKSLANVFYRLKLIEAYGTGIVNIIKSYENYSKKPKIEISDNVFKITLYNLNYQKKFTETILLNDNEKLIMSTFEKKEFITRAVVEELLKISVTMANNYILSLHDKGLIEKIGNGKNIKYIRCD